MAKKGNLIVVSGPSGAGKTTIINNFLKKRGGENFRFSVSATTRPKRAGEVDGRDYFFLTREEFLEKLKRGEFLEHVEHLGNLYGTLRGEVEEYLERGANVILDIDERGAAQIMDWTRDGLFIYIMPPSMEILSERLANRRTEDEESFRLRISAAQEQVLERKKYDQIIVNRDVEESVQVFGKM
ncbi:guanylate kinase, partial [Candidatus Hakubella thermalkaliphila]